MHLYYAIVHQDGDSAFGISFPDVPGCFSAADEEGDILMSAQEALSLFASDLQTLPTARSIQQLRGDPDVRHDLDSGAFIVAVPLISFDHKARYNLMLDTSIVAVVDRVANAIGVSRSEFVAQTLERRLKSESGITIGGGARGPSGGESTSKSTSRAASKVLRDPKASKAEKSAAASALTQSKSRETTGAGAAKAASKALRDPKASKAAKSAAASALTQKKK